MILCSMFKDNTKSAYLVCDLHKTCLHMQSDTTPSGARSVCKLEGLGEVVEVEVVV